MMNSDAIKDLAKGLYDAKYDTNQSLANLTLLRKGYLEQVQVLDEIVAEYAVSIK